MSYQIEFRHFKYFLAVAEDLHFRRAAERLFISQPGLSRQIKQMEDELGIQLFERHNRKVKLTLAGNYLKAELQRTFTQLDHILDHAKLLDQGEDGELKFGYVGSAMFKIIPKLLLKFKALYPKVHYNFQEMDNQHQISSLLSNEIDIGFIRMERIPRGLKSQLLLEEPFCLVLPKNHKINASNFKNLKQFENESFILFDSKYSNSYYEKVMQLFDDSGFSPIVSHNTIHAGSIFTLVENGFGISIVPQSLQTGYEDRVEFVSLQGLAQRTKLTAVWNENHNNPSLGKFVKLLHQNK